jgi:hypothetical protein
MFRNIYERLRLSPEMRLYQDLGEVLPVSPALAGYAPSG